MEDWDKNGRLKCTEDFLARNVKLNAQFKKNTV